MTRTSARPSPLRLRRVVRGLRLRDIAEATGLLEVRISQAERGESYLWGRRLAALAAYYDVSPEVLLTERRRGAPRHAPGKLARIGPPPGLDNEAGDLGPESTR